MTSHFNNKQNEEEVSRNTGFFLEDSNAAGQFDMNAEKYRQKQEELKERICELTGAALWDTKAKFGEYDYHICQDNNAKTFFGVASIIPGIPMYWDEVNGIIELKYRVVSSYKFKTTIIDADKLMKLKIRVRDMGTEAWIVWAFTNGDYYWKVDPDLTFHTMLGRNTQVTEDLQHEYKPQAFIPISLLSKCNQNMFEKEIK